MIYLKDVATLEIYPDKCTACGRCVEVCPRGVFNITDKKAAIENKDLCIECGACKKNCAFSAIEVKSGVGCANAILYGIKNNTDPSCDCGC